ncbi:hypothetical protein CGLO_06730 [Colletotrichum gloeosporioides Cg-14]|uniref:Uncharacterized protein n=1 Tax=Colletotrichum gloeosporioides (strain Cg-14) TaxID=1237896 RepID=T0KLG5_COLGC|nr:hypothetical protein CGLO_06730 [Colletotrichum gloeosporioides Cg-14]
MAFDNDSDVYEDHAELYHSGKRLILTPHKSPAPFGSSFYPDPPNLTSKQMTPTDEEKSFSRSQLVFSEFNRPLDFDETKQNDESSQIHLEILDMVDGAYGSQYTPGPQKVLCKVVQTASVSSDDNEYKALVDLAEFCFKVTVRAGFAQSNEVGAYSHLFKAGLTGFPHLAPQYHGCWTVPATSADPKYAGQVRHVCALALEYVEGRCLSDPFQPSGPTRDRFRSSWSNRKQPPTYISADEKTRLSIMERIMDGLMSEEFADVNHGNFHLSNMIISLKNGQTTLEQPRIVQVSYRRSKVTTLGRDPYKAYLYFAKKPHPFIRFSMNRLAPFFGRIPPSWEGQNLGRDTPIFLYRWLAITFGPFVDNPTYTFRGSPPADMIVDAMGTVSQYSMYLENKRLEESKPDEANKPDEDSEEKKPREETGLDEELL